MDVSDGVVEHSGFPNPATDNYIVSLRLEELLVKHPSSTFYMHIVGDTWQDRSVFDSDVAIIDRALEPRPADLVVWWDDDTFTLGRQRELPKDRSAWGVVTGIIHRYRT